MICAVVKINSRHFYRISNCPVSGAAILFKLNGFNSPKLASRSVRPEVEARRAESLEGLNGKISVHASRRFALCAQPSARTDPETIDTPQLAAGNFIHLIACAASS
jgi:hypothetical protein